MSLFSALLVFFGALVFFCSIVVVKFLVKEIKS